MDGMRGVDDIQRTSWSRFTIQRDGSETCERRIGAVARSSPSGHRSVSFSSSEPSSEGGDASRFPAMSKKLSLTALLVFLLSVCSCGGASSVPRAVNAGSQAATTGGQQELSVNETKSPLPRLVVWLTIDQFRGDYLSRY